ncbi:MAG: hypothetical protein NTY99_02985 [DPANN group archaeon]|nr:hypothetical protein [DPANN group archaeon]
MVHTKKDKLLLNIAKRMQLGAVPISIDEDCCGAVIMGPVLEEIMLEHPKNLSIELYEIIGGLNLREARRPCVYAGKVICYFDNKKKYNCPIAPLCKAYEKY